MSDMLKHLLKRVINAAEFVLELNTRILQPFLIQFHGNCYCHGTRRHHRLGGE